MMTDRTTEQPSSTVQPREHRKRVLKGASILQGIGKSEIRCTVRNMHKQGAELVLPPSTVVPDEFLLYVATDGIGYRASVRWRNGDRVGVEFQGTEPKPSWHYGN
jgi:hypothetical protein